MDTVFKKMDFSVKHWGGYPRRFPSPFPVANADYIERKNQWVRRAFETCDFSLILKGRGEFRRFGRLFEVRAPCVITQWPGEYLEYGPSLPEWTWDELYIVYDAGLMPRFKRSRLVDPERPVWPIRDIGAVRAQIAELAMLANAPNPEAMADRVDRVCERLVLETWLDQTPVAEDAPALRAVLAEVRADLSVELDFEEVAERHGMSLSTFRRRWAEVVGTPPARYLQELRIREACRLLVETSRPVHDVARAVGFADEFYFSRRFRQELKMAPRDYRKAYQLGRR